jgi:cellulose synthase/poly-beta-1,6-N-acetylglucosamine synthase-like glycosyltransferase/peptidoglycan/xylan/chitin deacetylase (PgdA/CDA1 family)
VWSFLDRAQPRALPDSASLARTAYPYDVEFEGDGELLTVAALPQAGERALELDSATGLFTDEQYRRYPTSYLLQRHGFRDSCVAITFDDGPSPDWTPRVLDALRDLHVPATFFVVGENAERHPDLISREWREGHEIGNHTYTHPNLAAMSHAAVKLELNATQRVLQSTLDRSTLLFRPPYNADAEPTSAEEVAPILDAGALGYVTVGEYLDPQDWRLHEPDGRRRSPDDIANAVVARVLAGHGNTLLLHDGGGDRSATVAALRRFVPELERRGYRFVTVSELTHNTRDHVMPPVSPSDRALLGGDRVAFNLLWFGQTVLHVAFLAGIVLGTARVLFVTALALAAWWRERRKRRLPVPAAPPASVSVVIAAYNEAPVIARTVSSVLASRVAPLEVIVVDDGSSDDTAGTVERMFGDEPRVHVMRQANGGKASALNRGIGSARGELLVCLDADTLFTPDTLGRLVAHFTDPRVGAVAGNVKVGNRINVWTRWQALEYITSQNLDRRAYALLDAITVVPGAVGAWRRGAVQAVGGFVPDTLAEDMDLTWRLRRAGWRIANETHALGFTEAPDSLPTLYRQRFRWSFGTLQCLWKHRAALGRVGWFGRLALPTLWVFQIGFPILSPIIDLQVLVTLVMFVQSWLTRAFLTQDWQPLPNAVESLSTVAFLYLFFFLLELLGAAVAIGLERERKRLLWWLFWQRFVYRQVMYAVVWRAVRTAITGRLAGWGKLERKNTAVLDEAVEG